jgi:hypothetical protein
MKKKNHLLDIFSCQLIKTFEHDDFFLQIFKMNLSLKDKLPVPLTIVVPMNAFGNHR